MEEPRVIRSVYCNDVVDDVDQPSADLAANEFRVLLELLGELIPGCPIAALACRAALSVVLLARLLWRGLTRRAEGGWSCRNQKHLNWLPRPPIRACFVALHNRHAHWQLPGV